jgi:hypothetical protein
MSLIITKQSGNFFSLVLNGGTPIISEQNRLTTIGNFANFKTANGANLILKQNVLFSDITIVTNITAVPVSVNDLWVKLIDAGFFNGLGISGGTSTINRFNELLDTFTYFGRDGQVLIVNESELKIDSVPYKIFTNADKLKLDNIENGAQVNINPDWNESNPLSDRFIENKPEISSPLPPDVVLKYGTVILLNLNVSVIANDFQWRIGGVDFLTTPAYSAILIAATATYVRFDLLVGKNDGTFAIKQGIEGATTANVPTADLGTIALSVIQIIGGAIIGTLPSVDGYIEKEEFSSTILNSTGIITNFVFPNKKSTIVFIGNVTQINSINYTVYPYPGKRIVLTNKQSIDVLVKNKVGTGIWFEFPNNIDFVLKPQQSIEFIYDTYFGSYAHHKYLGVVNQDLSNLVVKVTGKSLILDTEITRLASITTMFSKFILVHKITENNNMNIEINDIARGFGNDGNYWNLARYKNYTSDNNVNNPLNYEILSSSGITS